MSRLWIATVVAVAAAGLWWLSPYRLPAVSTAQAAPPAIAGSGVRWDELSVQQREQYSALYHELVSSGDSESVFAGAREFARMPPPQQDYFRHLSEFSRQLRQQMSETTRRELRFMPKAVQAATLYSAMTAEQKHELWQRRP